MLLFPAIDLIAGQVVRLKRGERNALTVYSNNPAEVAREFVAQGATWIHVVDLSATFEEDDEARKKNQEAIRSICAVSGISVDVGGGVRSVDAVRRLADLGAKRIALGTALVRDPELARQVAGLFPDLVVADVAARDGEVRVNGWREGEGLRADDLVARLAGLGFRHLVFTDIARDGMQTGIDVEAYRHIAKIAGFPVVASGGIASLDDLRALRALGSGIIEGAITGRALYEGNFSLSDALAVARGNSAAV